MANEFLAGLLARATSAGRVRCGGWFGLPDDPRFFSSVLNFSAYAVARAGGVVYYPGHVRPFGYARTGPAARGTPLASVGFAMPPQLLSLTEGPSILLDKPILLLGRH